VRASGVVIDLHFAVHHLTTPYLTHIRVLRHSEGWRTIAALNAFHHVQMYAYFGAWTAARTALPWAGSAQLVAGILVEGRLLWQKMRGATGAMWPNAVALCLGLLYLALWVRHLRIRTRAERNEEKDL
jgi:hypothetical protein